ncbi:TPA: tRNA (guanosine(37)-N1)-methyltransferase TrmD [Candidatus Saccharibacteria bacterium]|nr:tRNA (guanosine(37)-N1)-methyltransferase TrmD [Candidatus Saccharibacteria bacterium]HIO87500.1 tRNA (guanosine(37)-N1)-methyltransferase TrmD [Candidatus Saccharibacteria bacterium]
MKIFTISLFPEMFESYFEHSMMLKAKKNGHLELEVVNLRDFGLGPRKQVDDTVYGGGDGMLLKPEPVVAAIEYAKEKLPKAKAYLMSPRGRTFNQKFAQELSREAELILVCGRYEGFDERIREFVDGSICIGNYVLTGGELPAMSVIDAAVRLIPGVLGGEASAEIESFSHGDNLEYPQYTRPDEFRGLTVPEILKSGNHAAVEKWRVDNQKG